MPKIDFQKIVKEIPSATVDEMAVPSYTHWNPLIRWLMWKRLSVVNGICLHLKKVETALDFGTGTGVMLPFLANIAERVIAVDKQIEPARRLRAQLGLENIECFEVESLLMPVPDESVDLILCLDVLEHIPPLQEVIGALAKTLKPGGILIVSAPSENLVYKVGRWIAGFQKRATYHCWNAKEVNQAVATHLELLQRKKLFPLICFFEISVFQKAR